MEKIKENKRKINDSLVNSNKKKKNREAELRGILTRNDTRLGFFVFLKCFFRVW